MTDTFLEYEPALRLGCFLAVFAVMAAWEIASPRRSALVRFPRWLHNGSVAVLNTALLRLVFPSVAIGAAYLAQARGWGLLNHPAIPFGFAFAAAIIALDLAVYLQHVMFHAVPALWRLHTVHHADLDFDVTTGIRFHPAEILLSMVIKLAVVVLLGPPVVSVLAFEVLLSTTSLFNHANAHLPDRLDRILRWLVVTPDMHRVHHSAVPVETNSNFGFNLPWWDRLLGTYRDQPAAGHESMAIGVRQLRDPKRQSLPWLLVLPFTVEPGPYPIHPAKVRRVKPSLPRAEGIESAPKESLR